MRLFPAIPVVVFYTCGKLLQLAVFQATVVPPLESSNCSHSDSDRKAAAATLYDYQQGRFMSFLLDRIVHAKGFITPVVKHWLE